MHCGITGTFASDKQRTFGNACWLRSVVCSNTICRIIYGCVQFDVTSCDTCDVIYDRGPTSLAIDGALSTNWL